MSDNSVKQAFFERLRRLMGSTPPFVFAKKVGIPNGTFARMISESSVPKYEHLCRIAKACGVSLDWLLMGKDENDSAQCPESLIPVACVANCGLAQGLENDEQANVYLPVAYKGDSDAFAVLCRGQSMCPAGIDDGDVCIVSPSAPIRIGAPALIRTKVPSYPQYKVLSTVKRVDAADAQSVTLTGWLDADESGHQDSFREKRSRSVIVSMAPVVKILKKSSIRDVFTDSPVWDADSLAESLEAIKPYVSTLNTKDLVKMFCAFYDQNRKSGRRSDKSAQKNDSIFGGNKGVLKTAEKKVKKMKKSVDAGK